MEVERDDVECTNDHTRLLIDQVDRRAAIVPPAAEGLDRRGRGRLRTAALAVCTALAAAGCASAAAAIASRHVAADGRADGTLEVESKVIMPGDGKCEPCPAGHCDRGPHNNGPCVWFGPPQDSGAYHCRVKTCDEVPKGVNFMSACWQYGGMNFYSVFRKDADCEATTTKTHTKTTSTTETETTKTITTTATTTSTTILPERGIFEGEALRVLEDPVADPKLSAYWDIGTCGVMGEKGDDHNSHWCGGLVYKPKCKKRIGVPLSRCNSGFAVLSYVSDRDGGSAETWLNNCHYMYFAQYLCEPSTTTTTTTTSSTTTTQTRTTTSTTITTTSSTSSTSSATSTSTTATTSTTTTTTTTNAPGTCAEPVLGQGFDTSDCAGVRPPNGTCTVECARGYSGNGTTFICVDEDEEMYGMVPECLRVTSTTTTTTSTTSTTWQTTTNEREGNLSRGQRLFEDSLNTWGVWHDEAGFPDDCEDGFRYPAAPQTAVDYNGLKLPPTCYKKMGPHRVYVIGDWGGVLGKDGPVPANQRSKEGFVDGVDDVAQIRVADQMAERAKHNPPDYIINVGDNFYWAGLDTRCGLVPAYQITQTGQFRWVFENVYKGAGMEGKPWLSVLGNHDYGGYMFNKGWDQQIAYTWGPGGRWVMPAQYWSSKVHYPGFSVDYWFVDSNNLEAEEPHADADHNICSKAHVKENEGCGAMGPATVWDCPAWFKKLWAAQVPWFTKGLRSSTATWQVIVTHFPPTWNKGFWMDMAKEHGIDLFLSGHMHHLEVHYDDPGNFLYPSAWVISGGGGGITSEGHPNPDGIDDQYGFFELTFSKDEIEIIAVSHGGLIRNQVFVKPRRRGESREFPHAHAPPMPPQPHHDQHGAHAHHPERSHESEHRAAGDHHNKQHGKADGLVFKK